MKDITFEHLSTSLGLQAIGFRASSSSGLYAWQKSGVWYWIKYKRWELTLGGVVVSFQVKRECFEVM